MNINPYERYLTKEDKLQRAVIQYCVLQHGVRPIPCNTESKKTTYEQFKFKQAGGYKGILDLFIPIKNTNFGGLFIEIKIEDTKITKKDGSMFAGAKGIHISNQMKEMQRLRDLGYYATFGIGFEQCKTIIEMYINNKIK